MKISSDVTNLKPFKVLECDCLETIAKKTITFLKTETDLFNQLELPLWNKLDTIKLVKAIPELVAYCKSLGLVIREAAVTVCSKLEDVGLHIDELPVVAKINFPILNTENTFNEWYSIPQSLLDTVTPIRNHFGSEFYNLQNIELDQCTKIGDFELTKPIVFNSQLPHKVRIADQAKFPRIMLSCTFFKQPIDLLK